MEKKLVISKIAITAPAEKVWEALVKPEQTKKYMFGCETVSEWKPGSELLWQMMHEGKLFTAVKGNVVSIEPAKFLEYTVFDPHNPAMEDVPQNYLHVTYELEHSNNETLLTVTQGDYNSVADGEKRYKEAYNNGEGWNPILVQIKQIAEEKNT
jgi:uncharacterized protein YndB with AHSA1/START domain